MNLEMRLDKQSIQIIVLVYDFFKDFEKTKLWITTKNPMFGGISPLYMINTGRGHKVLRFINDAKEGNLP